MRLRSLCSAVRGLGTCFNAAFEGLPTRTFWSGLLLKCSEVMGPNRSSFWSDSVSVGNHRRQVPLPRFASNGGGAGRTRALDDSFLSLEKCFFVLFVRRSGGAPHLAGAPQRPSPSLPWKPLENPTAPLGLVPSIRKTPRVATGSFPDQRRTSWVISLPNFNSCFPTTGPGGSGFDSVLSNDSSFFLSHSYFLLVIVLLSYY